MGLGSWDNFRNVNGIEWVNEIKIFGLVYRKTRNQKNLNFWNKLLNNIRKTSESYYLKDATIFGRTTIINTILEPKFLYATHTFDPPKKIIKKYNAIIRNIYYKISFQ